MGEAGWKLTNKYDLYEKRFGESYGLILRFINPEEDRITLTPDEALRMGQALLDWGDKEKESGRPILT